MPIQTPPGANSEPWGLIAGRREFSFFLIISSLQPTLLLHCLCPGGEGRNSSQALVYYFQHTAEIWGDQKSKEHKSILNQSFLGEDIQQEVASLVFTLMDA